MNQIAVPSNYWGLIALICADVLVLFSTRWMRDKAYNLFLSTHIISFILILPAVSLSSHLPRSCYLNGFT